MLLLCLSGCNGQGYIAGNDFAVNNWTFSIGLADENRPDFYDEQKFSFRFWFSSETDRLSEVKHAAPIFCENILDMIIGESLLSLWQTHYDIEVQGYVIADTSGLTKEQILYAFTPFITALNIILHDETEYLVELPRPIQ
jgi:hypothetical protein